MTMLNGEPIDTPSISTASTAQPSPAPGPVPLDSGSQLLGMMALIFAIVFPLAGAIVGGIGMAMARRAGSKNPLAVAGFWVGLILTVVIVGIVVAVVVFSANLITTVIDVCEGLGSGTHEYNGVTYTCD